MKGIAIGTDYNDSFLTHSRTSLKLLSSILITKVSNFEHTADKALFRRNIVTNVMHIFLDMFVPVYRLIGEGIKLKFTWNTV